MPDIWYALLHRFAQAVYFARVSVIFAERLPKAGPVLYLGLHRNGAVDGVVYGRALGRVLFMISSQLRKGWCTRLIFNGIAVTRRKDEGDHHGNGVSLRQCLQHLASGGRLFVFPEGTSSLGPRHLPFKSGAAWLIEEYLRSGGPALQVIPVGIHYECPRAFRSKVEVVVGRPVSTDLVETKQLARLKELKRRIAEALENVGVNVDTAEYQQQIQQLAYISTLGTPRSYFRSLKAFETSIPETLLAQAAALESELRSMDLLHHQGVPLFPMGPRWTYLLALGVLSPLVLGGIVLNAPPFFAGWAAGKKIPDGGNVISLWKMLVGVPLFAAWSAATTFMLLLMHPIWAAIYLLLTWAALVLYYHVKKLTVAVLNSFRSPDLGPRLIAFRETVLAALPPETAASYEATPAH